jgi:uncharacterized protein YigE (DUF2233 family)
MAGGGAWAACNTGVFEGIPYSVCTVDPTTDNLRFWHKDDGGLVWGSFDRLADALHSDGQDLIFAMNGAMYHEDREPVGLYIEAGGLRSPIATREGPGNFGMLPNGVLCLSGGSAQIVESREFADLGLTCDYAMQSGPLLVDGGTLHPRLLPSGTSQLIRNGVGLRPDGVLVFAISDAPVRFHRFARLFRDHLGAPDALFIDGNVSRLFAPELSRNDLGFPMGPIVGVIRPAG